MILRSNLELGEAFLFDPFLYSHKKQEVFFSLICSHVYILHCSVAKHLESTNAIFSFVWWIIGFYWVTADSEELAQSSPQLYWFVFGKHTTTSSVLFEL